MLTPLGRLHDATLGDLLGRLLRARLDGSLVLDDEGRTARIHLRRGEVVAVEGDGPRLGALAVDEALVTASELCAALERDRSERRIGQKLVLAGLLRTFERDALLLTQRAQRLERLFRLDDAAVHWSPPSPFPVGAAELPPMSPARVLTGRPRRRSRNTEADAARRAALASLGLHAEASRAEVRARYRALVLALHPDRGASREGRLREVLSAWRTLSADAR
ncbi:MAG: J domain-containing protein [Polyangiales bacterium]